MADGDDVYLLVDSAGRLLIVGSVAHDAIDEGNSPKLGGKASTTGSPADVAAGDRVNALFNTEGKLAVSTIFSTTNHAHAMPVGNAATVTLQGQASTRAYQIKAIAYYLAPDAALDIQTTAGDSGPGLGAANVAPIGGDISLRASAVAGEANGTSTVIDNIGWIKSLHAVLDVTAVPAGGSPTLDVYL